MALKTYDGSNQTIVVIDTGYNNAYKYPGEVVYQYDFADKDDDAFNFKSNHIMKLVNRQKNYFVMP